MFALLCSELLTQLASKVWGAGHTPSVYTKGFPDVELLYGELKKHEVYQNGMKHIWIYYIEKTVINWNVPAQNTRERAPVYDDGHNRKD